MSHQLPELLPCPFCGASSHHFKVNPSVDGVGRYMKLECGECHGSTQELHFYEDDPELRNDLRAFWNSRAIASVKREPLSTLGMAALAREAFGNPIPIEAYILARAIEQAHGIGAPIKISLTTDSGESGE